MTRTIPIALTALALAAALAGCRASPTAEQRQAEYENAKSVRELHRIQADTDERDMRRIVREELERQQPRGARP